MTMKIEHKKKLNISPMNWAYIAGFFDGEGCIARLHGRSRFIYWRIVIAQQKRQVLDDIQTFTHYGNVYRTRNGKMKYGILYQYVIARQEDVLAFIQNVFRYSIVKRPKLQNALEHGYQRQRRQRENNHTRNCM